MICGRVWDKWWQDIGNWRSSEFRIVSGFTSCLFLKPKCFRTSFLLLSNNTKLSTACIVFWISRFWIKQRMCWNKKWSLRRFGMLLSSTDTLDFRSGLEPTTVIKHNFHLTISFSYLFLLKGKIIRSPPSFCFMQCEYVYHVRNSKALYKNYFWSSLWSSSYFFLILRNKETNLAGVA